MSLALPALGIVHALGLDRWGSGAPSLSNTLRRSDTTASSLRRELYQ